MKLLITILVSLLLLHPNAEGKKEKPASVSVLRWIVEPQSTLSIAGKSNINNFRCGIKTFLRADTLTYFNPETGPKQGDLRGNITIDVKQFDCSNIFITKDLRRTLKSEKHPLLTIRFISLDKMLPGNTAKPIKGDVEIEMAGLVRQYSVDYTIQQQASGQLFLEGRQVILFSDFKLQAPSRLAGLVKIEEDILVNFRLILKPVRTIVKA